MPAEIAVTLKVKLLLCLLQFNFGRETPPGQPNQLVTVAASRHLYESVLRKRVLSLENVSIETAAAVKGLQYNTAMQQVTGMTLPLTMYLRE